VKNTYDQRRSRIRSPHGTLRRGFSGSLQTRLHMIYGAASPERDSNLYTREVLTLPEVSLNGNYLAKFLTQTQGNNPARQSNISTLGLPIEEARMVRSTKVSVRACAAPWRWRPSISKLGVLLIS